MSKFPFAFLLLLLTACGANSATTNTSGSEGEPVRVRTGAEVFLESFPEQLEGKRLGLVMNPTSRVGQVHMLDTLLALGYNITGLYAPEHGFRGNFGAGEKITDGVDQASGLPVFSLYGSTRKPTQDMLKNVDVLIFDMQDVGARFYTYVSTLGLVMEAASEAGVEVWVLDRPNPAGGEYVAGWMLDPKHKSFIGAYPMPAVHGMTLGELARMMVGEGWLTLADAAFAPNVVPMEGWERSMHWPETGLDWVPPSPNIPTWSTSFVYLGTCIFEGSTFSEGRGTPSPFLTVGGPALDIPDEEIRRLNETWGISMAKISFTPVSIPDKAPRPKHMDTECQGVQISDDISKLTDPVAFGYDLFRTALRHTSSDSLIRFRYLVAGSDRIDALLASDENPADQWKDDVEAFKTLRAKYLLY